MTRMWKKHKFIGAAVKAALQLFYIFSLPDQGNGAGFIQADEENFEIQVCLGFFEFF